ncbi:Restriction endonuclease [Macrococcoides canis]|uniref:Restriction endonuclease n=1 Tax=Macrococcoides canis TaxID=1855823 RepID=A0A0D6DQV2_9STAP|nr:hypothetical protein [Macrococcus canis]ARQ05704.1 hypothetical protein MCCS_00320 [Macrococcus canis]CDO67624.1 hypothetical protein [Macrococcus canis]
MQNLDRILLHYEDNFRNKVFDEDNQKIDILMDVFGITASDKKVNKQYWGRQLGFMFEKLVIEVFQKHDKNFKKAESVGSDKPYDLQSDNDFIDTKYRVGSGDSGTLKKFKSYGKEMKSEGKNPVILILREDNLPSAVTALKNGEWDIYIGQDCFDYIFKKTNFDLQGYLISKKNKYNIHI